MLDRVNRTSRLGRAGRVAAGALGVCALAAGLSLGSSTPGRADTSTVNVSASVLVEGSVVKIQNLRFGALMASASSGTVAVNPDGSRTITGGVNAMSLGATSDTHGPAEFRVTCQKNRKFSVSVPSSLTITRAGGGASMPVTLGPTTIDPLFGGNPADGRCSNNITGQTGQGTILVGGALAVGANQSPGDYTGTFQVTVNF